jgi:hypothetical protein
VLRLGLVLLVLDREQLADLLQRHIREPACMMPPLRQIDVL